MFEQHSFLPNSFLESRAHFTATIQASVAASEHSLTCVRVFNRVERREEGHCVCERREKAEKQM